MFGAVVVSFLGGGEQWVQHLDRCLEHFHELEQALVGPAQPPGKGVGVRIILGEVFQLANVYLAHQGGNILVVFIAGFGFGHRDLVENGGVAFYHAKLTQVAAEFMQTLDRPGRHDGADITAGNAVFLFEDGAIFFRVEQGQGGVVYRRALEGIEGHFLHQRLELFGQGGFAATHRPKQIENLFLFFQTLGGVAVITDDVFDDFFEAVELVEGGVAADNLVGENA